MTTQFYVPPDRVRDDRLLLPQDEARHAARVLRMSPGDEIIAVDGEGGWYRAVLDAVGRDTASAHILERRRDVGEPPYRLRIATGLLKHRGRLETFLEKAVELGADDIVPLLTSRTEKDEMRTRRAENILAAAMKQCGRSRLPSLAEPTPLREVLAAIDGVGFCCHESAEESLLAAVKAEGYPDALTLLVGPEGGFTPEEIDAVRAAGCRVVSLGTRRLRAETAGMAAAAGVALAYDVRRSDHGAGFG